MKEKIKRNKPLFFILILLVLGLIGGTFAYYYNEVSFPNRFKTMTYNVTLEENFNDDWGTKEVFFKNKETTNMPVVLRINYNEEWSKKVNNETYTLSNTVNNQDVVTKTWTNDFLNNFTLGSDGWYYYKKVLNSGDSVQVLSSITLNENLIRNNPNYNNYKTYDYELAFNYEAIQANTEAVSSIWNKTITINGNDITWQL